MAFNRAPREVKEAIWKFALPDDEPEVCIMWPLRFQGLSQITEPLLVDIAFPVLMHICREWRAFVFSPSSGVRFRHSLLTGCQVPYRPYRAEMDAFFVSSSNAMYTLQAMARNDRYGDDAAALPNPGLWRTLRHLAVEPPVFGEAHDWLPELILRYSPNLRKVSVVFPSLRQPLWKYFHPPSRRCKLRGIDETTDEPHVEPTRGGEEEQGSIQGRVVSIQKHARTSLLWLDRVLSRKWSDGQPARREHFRGELTERCEGAAWNRTGEKPCLVYESASFVQSKRLGDGLQIWEEVCEDRIWIVHKGGSQELPSFGSSHRNPEIWRVNDDIELAS